jgi:hypothetical protein
MNLSVANEDIICHILSKCSIVSIMKLYALNRHFITDEMLKLFINNRWAIHIGKCIQNSILRHDYLDFHKKADFHKKPMIRKATAIQIADSSIWATNRIINMKYNNIEDKDVALNDLLLCYDSIYRTNNPQKKSQDIKIFKGLLGDAFDLNILAYVNIYKIYEIFTASTVGKMSVFKEKLKDNFIGNFDNCGVSLPSSMRSKIPAGILEKVNKKQVSVLLSNKNEMGLKYLTLLNTIFDNCFDVKYYKFKVYIAIQITKFINLFKNKENEKHLLPVVDKMRGFVNQMRYRAIPIAEYLYFYATFEISYILSKI